MIIKYKTPEAEERHAEYTLEGNWLTINDTMTVNLSKYESDDDFHMDICSDAAGNLTTGVIPGWSTNYVAQIDIPARTYHSVESEDTDDNGNPVIIQEADAYNPDRTTLTLWEEV